MPLQVMETTEVADAGVVIVRFPDRMPLALCDPHLTQRERVTIVGSMLTDDEFAQWAQEYAEQTAGATA